MEKEFKEAALALCPDCGCGGCLEELIEKENKLADAETNTEDRSTD
tara:strand:- start:2627 stop:2764 length:138 start_codon:yes stop_codon:yes gene_type:complete